MFFKNKSIKNRYLLIVILLILSAFSVFISYFDFENLNWKNIFNKTGISDTVLEDFPDGMSVHFIDVGKADATYIHSKNINILIDAGDNDQSNKVVQYLKRQGVESLDLVVASHPHRDHIGQMNKVISEFKIDKFMEPNIPDEFIPTSRTYENMLKALKTKKVNTVFSKADSVFCYDDLKIEVLGPRKQHETLNNNSIVMKVSYKDVSFLFTGDAEKFEEDDIISSGCNLSATVLKVAHHGSTTSSSYNFLKYILPKYAVIHVASDKSNCPKEKVIKRLEMFCADDIYRTDLNGTIIFSTDGEKINIKTEK